MHESIEHGAVVASNPSGVNATMAGLARISPHVTQLPQFRLPWHRAESLHEFNRLSKG
jgi:hypothetical protein